MNLNIENKKQIATILLAVALGMAAVFLTSKHIESSINEQTAVISQAFKAEAKKLANNNAALLAELQKTKASIAQLTNNQKRLEAKMKERPPVQIVQAAPGGAAGKGGTVEDTAVFSVVTPPGKRAITILIDSLSAVGGLVKPGDYVDVLAELTVPKNSKSKKATKSVTSVLFQDVQVLAVNSNFRPIGGSQLYQAQQNARQLHITLAMDAEEATLITFAKANGKLMLLLRSPDEGGTQRLEVASWEALADFVKEKQGTKELIPKAKKKTREVGVQRAPSDEAESVIQVFRGGREL